MADLRDNEQYVFDRSRLSNRNKTVLLLKLTDTSLKVLEDFQKLKHGPKRKGSISFNSNQGTISLPGASGCREFKIQVTSLPDASCECLQHKYHDRIESIGCIMNKVTIKATDDSYTATSDKMKQAEEELKKVSTKVIEQKNLKQGKKVKIRTPTSTLRKFQSQQQPESAIPSWKQKVNHRTPSLSTHKPSGSLNTNSSNHFSSSNNSSSNNGSTSSSSGYSSSSQSSSASNTSSPGTKPTSKLSCREHIIHWLAVRPYKKVELLVKLSKDGISNPKEKIGATLQQVAYLKDNTYSLQRHMYNEVKEDWSFYSSADRDIVKAKLQKHSNQRPSELKTPPKPPSVDKESKVVKQAVKRPILPEITDFKLPKIQRIAHSKRNLNDSKSCSPSSPGEVSTSRNSPKPDNGFVECNKEQHAPSPSECVSSTSSTPEYMSNFRKITNPEQRLKYKNVFNEEYKEYLNVYKKIENVQMKFSYLKESLSKVDVDSSEYEQIEQKVLDEYQKIHEDEKYKAERARFDELHGKLSFIKRLVVEYDNAQQELS
ncbi:RNA polymerase II elongation factor ELL-like [Anneissia japonica]|uniref:RNA polymerase II elongation factor ELL-like n=1 Tax=Anneissia japonica TaxID=1529436 RepID=UPI001425930F|nr:RNA polymerase II elongation factor ELL-like [Anneissia japonica]